MMLHGAVGLTQDGRPQGVLDGGRHFEDVTLSEVPHHLAGSGKRDMLRQQVEDLNLHRPVVVNPYRRR
jgi:hypothetical protein